MLLLLGFALPPLIRLGRVPTLRVLRRELGGVAFRDGLAWALGALVLAGLLIGVARDWLLGAWVVGGFAVAFGVFGLVGWLALAGFGRIRASAGSGWRYGLTALRRRPMASLIQVLALAMGLTALLLLTLVRGDLLASWQRSTPADAPNRFVINIQPEQVEPLRRFFSDAGRAEPRLLPMIRGRLVAVSGRPVGPDDYADDRARRLVDRDFNLSFDAQLPAGNSVVAGTYYIRVQADTYNYQPENAEGNNNLFSEAFATLVPPLPDLTVSNVVAPEVIEAAGPDARCIRFAPEDFGFGVVPEALEIGAIPDIAVDGAGRVADAVCNVPVGIGDAKGDQLRVQRQDEGDPVVEKLLRIVLMTIKMVVVIGDKDEGAVNIVISPGNLIHQQKAEVLRADLGVGLVGEIEALQGPRRQPDDQQTDKRQPPKQLEGIRAGACIPSGHA